MNVNDLDPRWQWIETTTFSDRHSTYLRGECNHLEVIPVESSVDGAVLAGLCLTCDAQLPPSSPPPAAG